MWIKIEDKLPEPGDLVVVLRDIADGLISGAFYHPIPQEHILFSPWLLIDNVCRKRCDYVTHWMKVPEVPVCK